MENLDCNSGRGDLDRAPVKTGSYGMSPACNTKAPLQLPAPPPGLTGKEVEKWRKDMAKVLEVQRKEEARMEKLSQKEKEKKAQLEAKLRKKVNKLQQKYAQQHQQHRPPSQKDMDKNNQPQATSNPAAGVDITNASDLVRGSDVDPEKPIYKALEYPIVGRDADQPSSLPLAPAPDHSLTREMDLPSPTKEVAALVPTSQDVFHTKPVISQLSGNSEVQMILAARKKRMDDIDKMRDQSVTDDQIQAKDDQARISQPLSALIQQSKACSGPKTTAPSARDSAFPIEEFVVDEIPFSSSKTPPVIPERQQATGQMQSPMNKPMPYSVPRKQTAAVNDDPGAQICSGSEPGRHCKDDVGLGIFVGCLTSTLEYIVFGLAMHGPASTSGVMRENDIIDSIDGVPLRGQSAESVKSLMEGPAGTAAHVVYRRRRGIGQEHSSCHHGWDDHMEFQAILTRTIDVPMLHQSQVAVKSMQSSCSDSNHGMIETKRIQVFASVTPQKYDQAVNGKCGVGISFEMGNGTLFIRSIDPHNTCPFAVGDELISVEGVEVQGNSLLVPTLIWGEPGSAAQLRVKRPSLGIIEATVKRRGTPEDASLLTSRGGLRTCGIGIVLEKELKTHFFYVKRVVNGGPAWSAGLQQGDMMLEIDGHDLRTLRKEDLPSLVVGPEGSLIRVKCLRGNETESTIITLTRSLDTAKVQSSNLATRLRLILAPSSRNMATYATETLAQALRADITDALETVSKRVKAGRITQRGTEGTNVYASVVLLPDFEGEDARGVEDLVRELVYQASNPRSKLRQGSVTKLVEKAEILGQVFGDKEEPTVAEPQDYPEGWIATNSMAEEVDQQRQAPKNASFIEEDSSAVDEESDDYGVGAPVHDLTVSDGETELNETLDPDNYFKGHSHSADDFSGADDARQSKVNESGIQCMPECSDELHSTSAAVDSKLVHESEDNESLSLGRRLLSVLGHPLSADTVSNEVNVSALSPMKDNHPEDAVKIPVKTTADMLMQKHPDRVPVVVERAEFSDAPALTESKFLAKSGSTAEEFFKIIRKRLGTPASVVFLVNGSMPVKSTITMFDIWTAYKGSQGFLTIEYDLANKECVSNYPSTISTPSIAHQSSGGGGEIVQLKRVSLSTAQDKRLSLGRCFENGIGSRLYSLEEEDEDEKQVQDDDRDQPMQGSDIDFGSFNQPSGGKSLQPQIIKEADRQKLKEKAGAKKQDQARNENKNSGIGMLIEAKSTGTGIMIAALAPGGPAEKSGLVAVGDELVAVDGRSVKEKTTAHAANYLTGPAGQTVHLTVIRGGKFQTVSIERGKKEEGSESAQAARQVELAKIVEQLDSVQIRLDDGFELPPIQEHFWEHEYIIENFSKRANELLDAVDSDIAHCEQQQKRVESVCKHSVPSSDSAAEARLDKQLVLECAQLRCRIMQHVEELEANKLRLQESEHLFQHRLYGMAAHVHEEILT